MVLFGKKDKGVSLAPIHVKKDRIAEYVPTEPENLSAKQLKAGIWLVGHRALLKKIGVGVLAAWAIISLSVSGYQWARYFLVGYWEDLDMFEELGQAVNYDKWHAVYGAKNLQISSPAIFTGAPGKYDLISEVKNINERWIARVSFRYQLNDGETEVGQATILPGKERLLAVWGEERDFFPTQIKLEITDVDWRKIDSHAVAKVADYVDSRLNFSISDFTFTRAGLEGLPVNRLEFIIKNESAYSYWSADFDVKMNAGGELTGAMPIVLDEFKAGEERRVDLRIIEDLVFTSIDPLSGIDVFDEGEFMPPEA